MRIFLLAMGTVLALLSACSPGQDRASDCKEWGAVSFWQTATLEMVAPCLEAGADPEVRQGVHGWTPLHLAAAYNPNPVVIARLVTAGADPNVRDISGETPLHWAARKNLNSAIIADLVAAGADPNAKSKDNQRPWDYAENNEAIKNSAPFWRLKAQGL